VVCRRERILLSLWHAQKRLQTAQEKSEDPALEAPACLAAVSKSAATYLFLALFSGFIHMEISNAEAFDEAGNQVTSFRHD